MAATAAAYSSYQSSAVAAAGSATTTTTTTTATTTTNHSVHQPHPQHRHHVPRVTSEIVIAQMRPAGLPAGAVAAGVPGYGAIAGAGSPATAYPGDTAVFADTSGVFGVPLVVRSAEDRINNPDRVSLDNRALACVPFFEGEANARMLSLQNNAVVSIEVCCLGFFCSFTGLVCHRNLYHWCVCVCLQRVQQFRTLMFLDLTGNRLERISGLEAAESLRVLMLGRNNIRKIENLEGLMFGCCVGVGFFFCFFAF
jgi:hypothetical protein